MSDEWGTRYSSLIAQHSSLDEVEQLELHLGADAAERGELDARLEAAEVAPGLAERAERPLQVAQRLPVEDPLGVDGAAAGTLVGGVEGRALADAADRQVVPAEAPGAHAGPGKV